MEHAPTCHDNQLKEHVLCINSDADQNSAGRIRTYNPPVNSRLLYH